MCNFFRPNARTVVLNGEGVADVLWTRLFLLDDQSNLTIGIRVLESVGNQVDDDLLSAKLVNFDIALLVRNLNLESNVLHVDLPFKGLDDGYHNILNEAKRLDVQRKLAVFD